jgi:hypothetical protein
VPVAWTTSKVSACEALMALDRLDEALPFCRDAVGNAKAPLAEKVRAQGRSAAALLT